MEIITLKAYTRNETGKQGNKRIRRTDHVPGVVHQKSHKNLNVKVLDRELLRALHTSAGENAVIKMIITDDKNPEIEKNVILQEVQHDPVKDSIMHIDFREISLTEKITMHVRVEAHGEAVGVKRDGGILEHMLWEVSVECLPTNIPEKISVDVTKMEIGDVVHIKDLVTPQGTKIIGEPETVVLACEAQRDEKEPTEEEAAGEGAAEPEVLKQKSEDAEKADEGQEKKA